MTDKLGELLRSLKTTTWNAFESQTYHRFPHVKGVIRNLSVLPIPTSAMVKRPCDTMPRRLLRLTNLNWTAIYFILSIVIFVFLGGLLIGTQGIWPATVMEAAAAAAQDLKKSWKHYLRTRPDQFIHPARYEGGGVIVHVPEKAFDGITLVTGLFGDQLGIRLLEMDGSIVHEWRVSFNEIWPDARHLEKQPHDWDTYIHGAYLYPNGDLIFNFEYMGLVKIDKCAKVLWKHPYRSHHSIEADNNGNLWISGRRTEKLPEGYYDKIEVPIWDDSILNVDKGGEILNEISIIELIIENGFEGVLFPNGTAKARYIIEDDDDITHLNDVEILQFPMSENFPMFNSGDVMISLRNLDSILVIEPSTKEIKWSMTGPFLRQHDPDFLPSGEIAVFDNRKDDANGNIFGGSRILVIDPATRAVRTAYEGDASDPFFTNFLGKQQHLANGNILITEGEGGRAFEVTPSQEIVWSFVNNWDEDEVATIEQATRYSSDYLKVSKEELACQ